jgi:hypothetical protein
MIRAIARSAGALDAYVGVAAMIIESKHMQTTDSVREMRRPYRST